MGLRNSDDSPHNSDSPNRIFWLLCLLWHRQDAGSWKVGLFKPIQLRPAAVEYREVVHRRSSCDEFPCADSQQPWKLVATNPIAGV